MSPIIQNNDIIDDDLPVASLLDDHQEIEILETIETRIEIPNKKRSGFDRSAFIAELKKEVPSIKKPAIKIGMGKSKSSNPAGFRHTHHHNYQEDSSSNRIHIRGIKYSSPCKVYLGALITVAFYLSVIATMSLLLKIGFVGHIGKEGYVILSMLLFFTILFYSVSRSCKCTVCRASFFGSKKFNKHIKAHQIGGMGYSFFTAIHIIFLFWLKCPACGTAQRLIVARKGKSK